MNNDLDGFQVWKGDALLAYQQAVIVLTVESKQKSIRFSSFAMERIGRPDYVNVFFNEHEQRVAFKAAEAEYPNALKMMRSSGKMKYKNAIFNSALSRKISAMVGVEPFTRLLRFPGYEYSGYLIFDLKKGEK